MCVSERERERERESVCVFVCLGGVTRNYVKKQIKDRNLYYLLKLPTKNTSWLNTLNHILKNTFNFIYNPQNFRLSTWLPASGTQNGVFYDMK